MSNFDSSTLGLWGGESEDIIKRDFPIHRACRDGDLEALRRSWAVATREQLRAEDKFYGWTPIHWAAYFGKIECLDALLAFGVAANLCTSKFKQTPCHIASFGGHPQCLVRLLRAGANFHAQDYLGETPIHKAARVGNLESIGVLLANGSRVNLCNNNGHTPCDLARMQGFQECVKLLEVSASRFNSNNYNRFGISGQYMAGMNGHNHSDVNGNCRPRKRILDDESIPNFKRSRVEISNGFYNHQNHSENGHQNGFEHNVDTCEEMEEELPMNENGNFNSENVNGESYPRAPSPGMDINLQLDMDMQLWGHQNGYGDTAETMPSPTNTSCLKHRQPYSKHEHGYDRDACVAFRGLQSRGWH